MGEDTVRSFIERHFRHFNSASLRDAAKGYERHMAQGGRMLVSMAGAMSTAELGISLAEMIRRDKVHAISCTGANLEEDLFKLVAHDRYERVSNYRDLTPQDEADILARGLSRVTDTCIPEDDAMRRIEAVLLEEWRRAEAAGERLFPHEYMYRVLKSGVLENRYCADPRDSWLMAAMEKRLPIFVPGWEDSTMGNVFAAHCLKGDIKCPSIVRSGVEAMMWMAEWYPEAARETSWGFFQIGGGIAGDFAICVVPLLQFDLGRKDTPLWGYFCQISDSVTSYGSYSGAIPNEKITWGKLGVDTPRFIIESDATIVAPLIFQYVLEGEA